MSLRCANCEEWVSYVVVNGKMLTVEIGTNERHNCRNSKYNIRKGTEARAKVVKELELKKIDDFQRIDEAKAYIESVNARLATHKLELIIQRRRSGVLEMSQKPTTKEETFLSFIRERFYNADPEAKQKFVDKVEGVDFDVKPIATTTETQEQEYFIDEDSKETGLTKEEYEFLQSDIEQAIEDANRKYGYGGYGFVDRFGNHYRDPRPRTVPESDLALERLEKEKGVKPRSKFKYKTKRVFATAVKIEGVNSNG